MKLLPLVWAGLWRKPARTVFTLVCVVVAFLLFGLLQGIDAAISQSLQQWKFDRLFINSRFGQPLPLAYEAQIASIPGITRLTRVTILLGSYQDPKNSLFVIATHPDAWLEIRPEVHVPKEQIEAVGRVRTGALVSDWLATKYGWKIGDHFSVQTQERTLRGTADWDFDVVGIMTDAEKAGDSRILLANFEYYDESRASGKGTANKFLAQIDDPRHAAHISRQIDQLFTNSASQTETQSEHETVESEIASLGDIGFFTRAIVGAVFFTLLVLTGNTMMESVRERTCEFAVLRTLGFSNLHVLAIIFAEALLLCVSASILGLVLAAAAFPLAATYVGTAILPLVVVGSGVAFAVGVATVSIMIPAWRAMRLNIIDALAVR
jgi:putative ABC transport system permease protein